MTFARPTIIIAILYLCVLNAFGQQNKFEFQHYYADDGLSHNYVLSISQDELGFMWFGTEDGLNRFDGINFEIFRHIPGNPTSLSHNVIRTMAFDHQKNIWLGGDQIIKCNVKKETFTPLNKIIKETKKLFSGTIDRIVIDHMDQVWVKGRPDIEYGRLFLFRPNEKKYREIKHIPNDSLSIGSDTIYDIVKDVTNRIWVATANFIEKYSHKNNGFSKYPLEKNNKTKIKPGICRKMCADPEGGIWFIIQESTVINEKFIQKSHIYYLRVVDNIELLDVYTNVAIPEIISDMTIDYKDRLWFSTTDNGLYLFNPQGEKTINFKHNPSEKNSLSNNEVYDLYIDRTNVLWVATHNGLNKMDLYRKPFNNLNQNPVRPNKSLSSRIVNDIYMDKNNTLWIATTGGGITKIKRYKDKPNQYSYIKHKKTRPHIVINNDANFIEGDKHGNIWFGAIGINKLNTKTGQFSYYHPDPENPFSVNDWVFWSMEIGPQGDKWFGSLRTVCKLIDEDDKNYKSGETRFKTLENLKWNRFWTIHEDNDKNLWIGSGQGLIKYDINTEKIKHFPCDPDSFFSGAVMYIYEDKNNYLWLATEGGGLHKFNKNTETFKHFYKKDGLPSNTLWGILEDNNGFLWVSTNNGLSRFNPNTRTFHNYYKSDGIQDNIFRRGACFKAEDGELIFGGINGITTFYPDIINNNPYLPQVVITNFFLANRLVKINDVYKKDTILNKSITFKDHISLHYTNKDFTIEFAGLHYAAPEENLYEYMLDGYDQSWKKTTAERRYATYTNMESGDYTFKVKASNNDKAWNHMGTSLHIHIEPPFWEKIWFYILVGSAFILITLLIIRIRVRSIKKEMKLLRTLMDNIPDTIFFKDRECRFTIINKAQAKLLGVKKSEKTKGKTDFEFYDKDYAETNFNEETEIIKTGKAIFNKIEEIKTGRKNKKWVSTTKIPIINPNGNITGLVGISRDITDMKLTEIELKTAKEKAEESDRLKSAFLSNMSHEIRTPMNAIIGFSNLLSDNDLSKNEREKYLQYIKNNGQSLLNLINDIIDIAKIESNQLDIRNDIFDLNNILEELYAYHEEHLKKENKKINLHFEKPNKEKSFFIYTDPYRLKQIMANLLNNAIKFTEKGFVEFGYYEKDDKLLFFVKDTGIGIEKDKQELIFQRFSHFEQRFKKNVSGTGLGLSITRSIIFLMGGNIWVESEPEKGTVFYFEIPYQKN